jgi:acyl-coenzyme A synthetase/AMP-(fatty) acid ligase/thioesterase domain-containing protein
LNLVTNPYTKEELLGNFFGCVEKIAQEFSRKPFIVNRQGTLTFGENLQHANQVANAITRQYGFRQVGVGLFLEDPRDVFPAMIGILKSGNYIIPFGIDFPAATLTAMCRDANIQLILTRQAYREKASFFKEMNLPVLSLEEIEATFDGQSAPTVPYKPQDIVQILFTSGSTGAPKGAVEDYRYLTRAALQRTEMSGPDANSNSRYLRLSTFTFSGTHTQVFASLLDGSSVHFYSLKADGLAGLPTWIRDQAITDYSSAVTIFRSLVGILKRDEVFPSVKHFALSGERRVSTDIEAIRRHFPAITYIRLGYGSTELPRVSSTRYPVDSELFNQPHLPCGKPTEDVKILIWDEEGMELPIGAEGEIVVYGDSMARGYINNPELTRQRFIADPHNEGWQYFKTGDLGKLLPDGQLLVLGRADNMVKINGVRIELDALETHLLKYPGVVQVASAPFDTPHGTKKLACYYVAEDGIQIPVSDLRKHLAQNLPRHLLPHFLIPLDTMPMTGSGKVARTLLPPPQFKRPNLPYPYREPGTELEKKLVKIWEEEIGITGIGVDDDFFDVGGDSLIGVILFARIEDVLQKKLPVSVLLTASTVRKQAALILGDEQSNAFSAVIPIQPGKEGRAPLFFIPGKGGYPVRVRHLAKGMDGDTPIFALQGLMTRKMKTEYTIESVASFYLNEIRKVVPNGPYLFVGESMGGKIALEMAQQLLKLGQQTPLLVMLDTFYTANWRKRGGSDYFRKLRFYGMLLRKHLTILWKSDRRGRQEYFSFYGNLLREKIRKWRSGKNPLQPALPDEQRLLEKKNLQADAAYQPRPYPGKVVYVKATRGKVNDLPANGWETAQLGGLDVYALDCYHGSILFEPAVGQLAEIIQGKINELQDT